MIRKVCVITFLFLLFIPILLKLSGFEKYDYALSGYNDNVAKPGFSWRSFLSSQYQDEADIYLQQNIPFKGYLIALKNQLDYSAFDILHYTIEQGSEGQLFFWNHVNTHCGHLSISNDSLQTKIKECLYIKSVFDSMGITHVYMLAPGKPAYLEDKLPAKYKNNCTEDNEYHHVLSALNKSGLPVIDYNAWFKENRATYKYPVFPRLGIHWSYYAACLVMDTLDKYIAAKINAPIAQPQIMHTTVTDQPYKTDKDLWALLNLLLPMRSDSLAYPEYKFDTVAKCIRKPKVVIIGDSFGWVLLDTKVPANVFSADSRYWFYKRQLYDLNSKWISDAPSRDEIYQTLKGADMVIFLSTEVSNFRLDFEFANWLKANRPENINQIN